MGRSRKEGDDWMDVTAKKPAKDGRDIPQSRIDKAVHSGNAKIAKAANLAKTFAKYKPQ